MYLAVLLALAFFQSGVSALPDASPVKVIDGGKPREYKPTAFNAGPAAGGALNGHFFPSVIAYNTGRYGYALTDLTFLINNNRVIDDNPRKPEFMSVSHYLRGMIYLYHAQGVGRHELAKADFEAAIQWNPTNYVAYLELSRVYSDLGLYKEATSIVQHVLELKPPRDVADEAEQELKKLANRPL